MSRFVGCDPSLTSTGLCIIDGDSVEVMTIKTPSKLDDFTRQKQACVEVCKRLQRGDILAIEDFGISARFAPSGKFVERIEMCGMIKLLVTPKTKAPWFSCPPNVLKLFASGKASAKKEDVFNAVKEVWRQDVKNNDEADAFALAKLVQFAVTGRGALTQQKAVDKFIVHGTNANAMARLTFLGMN